ncbi:hypothetical protein CV102_17735 [Natronococcus pandeyae]|uniref:Putative peptidase inhibitor domain-containing protein n=1 Tax=Natronococcus pandeyae TaxID=2055836 RepID=A0A8J8TP64_9EURY|nr:hypothetical protein [Natronococcus pandeyae]TYL37446.1 hypothetical protein CV102_17735 [Natronococcus pandeyae]
MLEYIDPQVKDLRGSNSPIEVTLLIGVSGEYDDATACESVEQAGGTVDAEIGRATLRVTAPETAIELLCTLEEVKSIELERDDVQVLAEGNQHSRPRVTQ